MTKGLIKLCSASLPTLRAAGIRVPTYDRSKLKEGIVHFGVGGFHRAHLAQYNHLLLNSHGITDWAICGIGLLPSDKAMRNALLEQDCLYTIVERSAQGSTIHVAGSITSYLYAPEDPEKFISKLADKDTRIVSLTITESGYCVNEGTGELDLKNETIAKDLEEMKRGGYPATVYGYIVAGLARRKEAGLSPFTVMSCDNVVQNGNLVKKMLLEFTRHIDEGLAVWLARNGAFPNSMVDRITPRTRPEDIENLARKYGITDSWPVITEPFTQWVMEDEFTMGRPPWEKVGVQIVRDVEPFEKMKLTLLNGTHSAIGYLAHLAGYEFIHDAIWDPQFQEYIRGMMQVEMRQTLDEVPGIDLDEYCNSVIERFSNPTLGDRVLRICQDGSGKMPKYILPAVASQIARGGEIKRLALCVAAWFRFLSGKDEQGKEYIIDDPMASELNALALRGGPDPTALLTVTRLFVPELRHSTVFLREITLQLHRLYEQGARATLEQLTEELKAKSPERGNSMSENVAT